MNCYITFSEKMQKINRSEKESRLSSCFALPIKNSMVANPYRNAGLPHPGKVLDFFLLT